MSKLEENEDKLKSFHEFSLIKAKIDQSELNCLLEKMAQKVPVNSLKVNLI